MLDHFEYIKPIIILEKPHGNSIHDFHKICNNLDHLYLDYIFNDHYIFKNDITIHEDECINHIEYNKFILKSLVIFDFRLLF
jgi:glucose-6-phosphate 1-dehydrogenase